MSDSFEVTSDNGSELRAFVSLHEVGKFALVVQDNYVRAPEVSVYLTPKQAIDLAEHLVAFARVEIDKAEEPTDRFAMGTPSVDHAGKNKEDE